ncbi:MAG: beta-N-acetylhexosaminidase [Chloroflexota bacterium]
MVSLEEKIGQMCMVGFHGLEPPDYILEWLASGRIGGVILFSRNIESPEQVAKLTQKCHQAAKHPILIGIDQEGGSVARLQKGFSQSPGAMALGASGSEDLAYQVSKVMATEMRTLGINWDYAPVVDITHNISNPSVGTRSLGTDKNQVSILAAAEVRGFQAGGVAACAKHFPGLGNTPVDTHEALAIIDTPLDLLWNDDLVPFRAAVASGVKTVMITHVTFESLDSQYPATLSPTIIKQLLREKIGFTGVTTTDCMEMKAIMSHYEPGEAAALAALAGQDLILFSHTRQLQEAAYDGLLQAARSGRLPIEQLDAAVERISALKAEVVVQSPPDLSLIRSQEHLQIMQAAARASISVVQADVDNFPLESGGGKHIGVVEFAAYLESNAAEPGGQTGFIARLNERLPGMEAVALQPGDAGSKTFTDALLLVQRADILIVATRSAHLFPKQMEWASQYLAAAKHSILICLRNPYDVDVLPGADTVICTCGDNAPSIQAVVDALMGDYAPTGHLPVSVKVSLH